MGFKRSVVISRYVMCSQHLSSIGSIGLIGVYQVYIFFGKNAKY